MGGGPTGGLLSALMCIRVPLATNRALLRSSVADSDASEAPLRALNLLSEPCCIYLLVYSLI